MPPKDSKEHLRELRLGIKRSALPKFKKQAGFISLYLQAIFPSTSNGTQRWERFNIDNQDDLINKVKIYKGMLERQDTSNAQASGILPSLIQHLKGKLKTEPNFKETIDKMVRETEPDFLAKQPGTAAYKAAMKEFHNVLLDISRAPQDVVTQALVTTYLDILKDKQKRGTVTDRDVNKVKSRIEVVLSTRFDGKLESSSGSESEASSAASISHRTAKLHGTTPSRWAAARAQRF